MNNNYSCVIIGKKKKKKSSCSATTIKFNKYKKMALDSKEDSLANVTNIFFWFDYKIKAIYDMHIYMIYHSTRNAHCFLACSGISFPTNSVGTPFSSDHPKQVGNNSINDLTIYLRHAKFFFSFFKKKKTRRK